MTMSRIIASFFFLWFAAAVTEGATAQENTTVYGVVTDSVTGQPIPFVNIVFKAKNIGTMTDINGHYRLYSQWASGVVIYSAVGYKKTEVPIRIGERQKVDIALAPTTINLEAVQVVAKKKRYRNKDNPAVILIRKVIANRDLNRGREYDYYQYEKYEKNELDLNNFTAEWLDRKILKDFKVLKNYIDTSELNGKPYIPLLLKEKISNVYYRKTPRAEKEIVIGTKISGFENSVYTEGLDQYIDRLNGPVDIFQNKIDILDKPFTSPLATNAPAIYRFYITDSVMIDSVKYYELSFLPRDPEFIAFTGKMLVSDSTLHYGVREIELNIDKRININFLNDMRINQWFEYDPEMGWHQVKDKMLVDIQPWKRSLGIYSTKTTSYYNFKVNQPMPDSVYSGLTNVVYLDSTDARSENFWDTARSEPLSRHEEKVYELADTITSIPTFKQFTALMVFFGSGYYKTGPVDLGPITSVVSYNDVEGLRVRLGFRTNLDFHEKWRFKIYGAYGFTDTRFKYAAEVDYYFNKEPRRRLHVGILNDIYQPGFEVNWQDQDNLFLSFRRTPNYNMFYRKQILGFYEHEWLIGFSNRFSAKWERIEGTRLNEMHLNQTDNILNAIQNNVVSLGFRLAVNEKFFQGKFKRRSMKTTAPVFSLNIDYSDKFFGSTYDYWKFHLSIRKRFKLGILGYTDTELEGFWLKGKVAYPLLIIHRGNETITYDERSYNLMNFLEFVSDRSAALFVTHHFNGLIFGLIPLLDRTKIRLVISGKFLFGYLDDSNFNADDPELVQFPSSTYTLNNGPYIEASIGIENIFRFVRFDVVKRFTYLDHPNLKTIFGLNGIGPRIAFVLNF